jgi:hypothetical protein
MSCPDDFGGRIPYGAEPTPDHQDLTFDPIGSGQA